jgi:MFS family permease
MVELRDNPVPSNLDSILHKDDSNRPKAVRIDSKPKLSPLQIPASLSDTIENVVPEPPPRDRGLAAYTILFAATTISSFPCGTTHSFHNIVPITPTSYFNQRLPCTSTNIRPGFYLSYGVYQAYYQTAYPKATNSAWIGSLSSGLPFLLAPLMVYVCTHTSFSRIHFVWISWLLGIIALIGAAFSLNINSLIVTQGLLFGLSIVIGDNPLLIIVNTWWRKHRGLAYGVIFGVCDLFGVAWSFLGEYLLRKVGQKKTFLIFAAMLFAVPGPCLLLMKERGSKTILHKSNLMSGTPKSADPDSRRGSRDAHSLREAIDESILSPIGGNYELTRRDTPPTKKRFWRRPLFYVFGLANFVQSLAFYLPLIYLPTYALQIHSRSNNDDDTTTTTKEAHANPLGAQTLALLNLAQILGEVLFGRLSDLLSVHLLALASTSIASLSTFLLWGFATNKGTLLAYGFVFGFSGAGWLALWARMGMLFGEKDSMMVFALLNAGRGVGGVISGPVSVALLGDAVRRKAGGGGWAMGVEYGKYRDLTIFVGVCMAASALLSVLSFVIDRPEKEQSGATVALPQKKSEKLMRSVSSTSRNSARTRRKSSAASAAASVGAHNEKALPSIEEALPPLPQQSFLLEKQGRIHGIQPQRDSEAAQHVLDSILWDLGRPTWKRTTESQGLPESTEPRIDEKAVARV